MWIGAGLWRVGKGEGLAGRLVEALIACLGASQFGRCVLRCVKRVNGIIIDLLLSLEIGTAFLRGSV